MAGRGRAKDGRGSSGSRIAPNFGGEAEAVTRAAIVRDFECDGRERRGLCSVVGNAAFYSTPGVPVRFPISSASCTVSLLKVARCQKKGVCKHNGKSRYIYKAELNRPTCTRLLNSRAIVPPLQSSTSAHRNGSQFSV